MLLSDLRQSTWVSPGRCLDLAALEFRDPSLDTVGQIEGGAERSQLLVSAESGGPAQPMRLPGDEAEPPKTEAVQTSGAHTAFNPLLLFQSVVWGRCNPISRGLWDLQRTLENKA